MFLSSTFKYNSSLNFAELFRESRIPVIREQSVAQFLKLQQNGLEITIKSSVIFKVKVVIKGFNNYYRKKSWKYAEKFRRN